MTRGPFASRMLDTFTLLLLGTPQYIASLRVYCDEHQSYVVAGVMAHGPLPRSDPTTLSVIGWRV
jgi:hypothetical protein